MIYNLSQRQEYLTQRDNIFIPLSSCNTTAAIMALVASGIDFYYPKEMQPEDYLTKLLSSPEAYEKMRKDFPWAIKDGYRPQEVHGMLEWGINILVGRKVDSFTTKSSLKEIAYNIVIKGTASLVSGKFTQYGHIVAIVGLITEQKHIDKIYMHDEVDLKKIKSFVVDDPYGNYHTGYNDFHGNDIEFTVEELNGLLKTYNSEGTKWAHLLIK